MAREQYIDIIDKVLSDTDYQYGDVYINGIGEQNSVLILTTTDTSKLNELFKQELKANNIDTYPDYDYDDYYIDFATGGSFGYEDEFYICSECNRAFRYDYNGYGHAQVWFGDGFCMCADCTKENPEDYIEYLVDNYDHANVILDEKTLNGFGYYKQNDEPYASGLYNRHDNPKQIAYKIHEEKPNARIIFSIKENYNPYEEEFDVYIKE